MAAKLIYTAITSLDGYVADAEGRFDWSAPDEEVHAFVNDHERPVGTYLLGRRMYEVLLAWETMDTAGEPAVMADYKQLWLAADKIVFSSTLTQPSSARTRIEASFDPDSIRELKRSASRPISVGGPLLASHALKAGLVDEVNLFLNPVVVGGGIPALPEGLRADLELRGERRFAGGVVYLHYSLANGA
jgi:dihydrofolate reductase